MATRSTARGTTGGSLKARFALSMTIALAVVVSMSNYVIFQSSKSLLEEGQHAVLEDAVLTTAQEKAAGRKPQVPANGKKSGKVMRFDKAQFGPASAPKRGTVYKVFHGKEQIGDSLIVSNDSRIQSLGLLRLMAGLTILVIVVGGIVAVVVSGQITKPLEYLVEDVRQIARGNLGHHTRIRGGGEVASVAKAIDRMSSDLVEAQEAELELSSREREMEVAGEVREALLPQVTPTLAGYDIAGLHVESEQSGGTFHDFIECDDGSLGVLVCDVSGLGLPGALVGATARSYLRSELARNSDVAAALKRVNHYVAGDMRRGMYVTALYLRLEPDSSQAVVACAGHKLPLVRTSADGTVRLVQPEGIALGFDAGPVFDRALQVQELELEAGDHLVLSGAVIGAVTDPAGAEFGEKSYYNLVRKMSKLDSESMLDAVVTAVEMYADGEPFPSDLSIVSVVRNA